MMINTSNLFGSVELRTTERLESGKVVFYNETISYDRHGIETGRAESKGDVSFAWGDGSPITADEFEELKS